jgi:hypothetical protein
LQLIANAAAIQLGSDIWTGFTLFRLLFQIVFLLVPSTLIVYLAYRVGQTVSPRHAAVAGLVTAFSFAPIYYGVGSSIVLEPLSVALFMFAIWSGMTQRPVVAGLALGCGAALKLIPVIAVPALLLACGGWRERIKLLGWTAAALTVLLVPAALANTAIFMSPFSWQTSRPAWESWYAMVDWLSTAPHPYLAPQFEDLSVGHAFGWVFWGITPTLTALTDPVPRGPVSWENVVSIIGTVVTLGLCLFSRSTSPQGVARWVVYCTAALLLWSPGWSPQYELYLIPFVVLAFDQPILGLIVALSFEVVTGLDYPLLLPWAYYYGGSVVWLSWSVVVVRCLFLGWLCVGVLREETSLAALSARTHALRRLVA